VEQRRWIEFDPNRRQRRAADIDASLRTNPTYRKFNPADSPILILGLTSDTLTPGQLYDSAATIVQQRMSQIEGVGNVDIRSGWCAARSADRRARR
jgi:multidrug efflux pump subunit AcrB